MHFCTVWVLDINFHRGALIYVRIYQSNEKEFGVRVQLLT